MKRSNPHLNLDDYHFYSTFSVLAALAIIFVLLTISIPMYQKANDKAELTELQMFFVEIKTRWQTLYGLHGDWPNPAYFIDILGEPNEAFYFHDISIIEANYSRDSGFAFTLASSNPEIDQTVLQFTPVANPTLGTVVWLCGYAGHPNQAIAKKTVTTIPPEYLPASCKSR